MKEYYEAHITMLGDKDKIRPIVEKVGWKFSCIDGDPVLGEGIKCYATTFFNTRIGKDNALANLDIAANLIEEHNIEITRRKIELVIYDTKSSKVDCDGACTECL